MEFLPGVQLSEQDNAASRQQQGRRRDSRGSKEIEAVVFKEKKMRKGRRAGERKEASV